MTGHWVVLVIASILILGTLGFSQDADAGTTNLDNPAFITVDTQSLNLINFFSASGEFTIEDIGVRLSVEHQAIGDLIIEIESPQGTRVRLHDNTGGLTANIEDVLYLDSLSDCPVSDTCTTVDGPGTLADFIGENPTGGWALYATDTFSTIGQLPGTVTGEIFAGGEFAPWGIAIGTQLLLNIAAVDSDGDGAPDSSDVCPGFDDTIDVDLDGIPDCNDPIIDSDNDGVPDSSDVCPGFDDNADVDLDGIPDGCDADTVVTTNLDNPAFITVDTQSLNLINFFSVSGETTIEDIGVRLSVQHQAIGDLIIEIESPQGTRVRLHDNTGGLTANIEDVLYLDSLSDCPVSDTCTTVDGPGTLADFIGENPNGGWALYATDTFSTVGQLPGTVTGQIFAGGGFAPWGIAIGTQLLLKTAAGVDSDGDGVPDDSDNCPTFPNDQTDTDSNGLGDACEPNVEFLFDYGPLCQIQFFSGFCTDPDGLTGPAQLGDGQLSVPHYMAVNSQDQIFVTDRNNHRIIQYDDRGNLVLQFGTFCKMIPSPSAECNTNAPMAPGVPAEIGDGQFNLPEGIAVDRQGRIWIGDKDNSRVQVFNSNGEFLFKFGRSIQSSNAPGGEFGFIHQMAYDNTQPTERILITDDQVKRVQVFDSNANFLFHFGQPSFSGEPGTLVRPFGVAVDSFGNYYVADGALQAILKFDSAGGFIKQVGSFCRLQDDTGCQDTDGDGIIDGNGQFLSPLGLAFDSNDLLYVADRGNHRIQIFDTELNFLAKFGTECNVLSTFQTGCNTLYPGAAKLGDGQFRNPVSVIIDTLNRIVVADTSNSRLQLFGVKLDSDGDNVHDPVDNCLAVANTDQSDVDADGIGDVCDPLNEYFINGKIPCVAIGAEWFETQRTCQMRDADFTVGPGETFEVDSRIRFSILNDRTFTNQGTATVSDVHLSGILVNSGDYFNLGAFLLLSSESEIINTGNFDTTAGTIERGVLGGTITNDCGGVILGQENIMGTPVVNICPIIDTDGDGVPDNQDICPGFDDTIDTDGDGIPDGCDSNPNAFTAIQNGDWNDPNIWEGGIVPGETDDKEISLGILLTVSDFVTNSGTIDNSGRITVLSTGTIDNSGTIDNNGGARARITNSGTIDNSGTINNKTGFSTFTNNGTINMNGGTINTEASSTFTNNGTITIFNGNIFNRLGTFTNTASGTINISGSSASIYNGFRMTNDGAIINNIASIITNDVFGSEGIFTNNGPFENNGLIRNINGATINNSDIINNGGTIDNSGGTMGNDCEATITGTGTLFGNPVIDICDSDNDGIIAEIDNCRFTANPFQEDSDIDGVGDACDNAPFDFNPGQEETDGDGIPDVIDPDDDNDGILDEIDLQPLVFSNDFQRVVDMQITSFGFIENSGDQFLTIEPSGSARIRIEADEQGGAIFATINGCNDQRIRDIGPSESWSFRCSGIDIDIESGQVLLTLLAEDGSTAEATLDTGDSFSFNDETFTMESIIGTTEITLVADDGTTAEITLTQQNAITFDPVTSEITAPLTNPDNVLIIINGEPSSIPPGETATVNVPPTVGDITAPIIPTQVGTSITASADFTDPGTIDTHTAQFDWGDGSTSAGTVTETEGSGGVAGDHTYTIPGTYTVTLTVTDNNGDSDSNTFQFVVIYDPEGGFVTGGGWIDSPNGAYIADDSSGKANFGFVSKYKKGFTTPTGETEFQFKVANLNFHSDSYDWLVVAGHKAMYKGVGTINQAGNFGFMLSAIDEKLTPSADVDLFRIKIWDKDNGDALVYDNQVGEADDDADPTTAISGGQIVIHTAK